VLDPFAGSGTTLVVAKKLSRNYIGIELSNDYVTNMRKRLDGASALPEISGERNGPWPEGHIQELQGMYIEAGVASDKLVKNHELFSGFVRNFNWRLEHSGVVDGVDGYTPEEVWVQLMRLRKSGKLGKIKVHAHEDASKPLEEPQWEKVEGLMQ
jgi:site-specific DNA-methyltransferase (adenine-specific)